MAKDPPEQTRYKDVHHDDGDGNWLVSYADLMTLLFGFFVILASLSVPNAVKLEEMKQATSKSMNVAYVKPYADLITDLQKVIKESSMEQDIKVIEEADGVALVIRGALFFDSGSSELLNQASSLITKISPVILRQASNFRVIVEGHTDDVPIVSTRFPSNWELSSARASSVVRLLEGLGYPHDHLRPVGLSDTQPLVPNDSQAGVPLPDNRAQNRRILIRMQRILPSRMSSQGRNSTT
jgi:chemotaxis protein MotB